VRTSGVLRFARVVAGSMVCLGAIMVTGGAAGSAAAHPSHVGTESRHPGGGLTRDAARIGKGILKFDNVVQQATLTLPPPPCTGSQPNCQWMLFMNEPRVDGKPVVGMVTGTSGVLTLKYPPFCGIIQVDALIGPSPWVFESGLTHVIAGCKPPPSTTATPPTTTTSPVPPKVSSSNSVPPQVSSSSTIPNGSSALPFTAATSTTPIVNGASQLPFTGADVKLLAILGSLLILVGGLLLTTVESRRRALTRGMMIKLDQVKDGANKTSSWFLGR
jgi:hypothetical protein